ncbi:DUF1629 domain-containing protein [Ruegeria sp. Ofav3-42]|uniref:DUF1629 domain-containing protein n=1 Tax=Ruegeria sp. Ofav3-42 TaxID=2917759 RepID=UPI001EF5642C|nr:DUF1629 domain-containing protein [Ruegeria sp. Ofav3-42]MCG7522757.1 DUF1629 domain-containing protein [Ruegeria sp. Ofav3-42]
MRNALLRGSDMGVIIETSEEGAIDYARLTAADGHGEEYTKKRLKFLEDEKSKFNSESLFRLIDEAQKNGTKVNTFETDTWGNLRTRVPSDLYPSQLILGKGLRLLDYDGACDSGLFVSSRFRDLVEEFDPGVHDFCPVEVVSHDGESLGTHYFCRFLRPINAIRVEGSKHVRLVMEDDPRGDLSMLSIKRHSEVSVYADRIAGFGGWRDMRSPRGDFVSGALWRRMQEFGLSVGAFLHFDEC